MLERGFSLRTNSIDTVYDGIEDFENGLSDRLDDNSFLNPIERCQALLANELEVEFLQLDAHEQLFFKMGVKLGINAVPAEDMATRLIGRYISASDRNLNINRPINKKKISVVIDPLGRRLPVRESEPSMSWLEDRMQHYSPEFAVKFHKLSASLEPADRPFFDSGFARTVAPFIVASEERDKYSNPSSF